MFLLVCQNTIYSLIFEDFSECVNKYNKSVPVAKYLRVFFCYELLHMLYMQCFVAYIANKDVCNFNLETPKSRLNQCLKWIKKTVILNKSLN